MGNTIGGVLSTGVPPLVASGLVHAGIVTPLTGYALCLAHHSLRSAMHRCLRAGGVVRTPNAGPLAGMLVIDMSVVIAGPWCPEFLAEMGAEVIKIETTSLPDSARGIGASPVRGMAALITATAHGKRSIVLDLKHPEGHAAFMRLVRRADCLVQNFRPGAMERLGLSYEELAAVNPRMIMVSSSGFGPTGPRSGERIYDPLIQVASGLSWKMADPAAGNAPVLVMQFLFDKITAMHSTTALLAAAYSRNRRGDGQHVVVAMLDAALWTMWSDVYADDHTWATPASAAGRPRRKPSYAAVAGLDPDGPLPSLAEVSADPVVQARRTLIHKALFGAYHHPVWPIAFSRTPAACVAPAPMLGEDTVQILAALGLSAAEVAGLLAVGAATSTSSLLARMGQRAKSHVFAFLEALQGGPVLPAPAALQSPLPQAPAGAPPTAPLAGLKVLEVASGVAGPTATALLAAMGAEVVKVEGAAPDRLRKVGAAPPGGEEQLGAAFVALNRGKRAVRLGADEPTLLPALLEWADVVLCDVDTAEAVQLPPADELEAAHPALVVVVIGRSPGELQLQRQVGMESAQPKGRGKAQVQFSVCMKATGLFASVAALSALLERDQSGRGQVCHLDGTGAAAYFSSIDCLMDHTWTPASLERPGAVKKGPDLGLVYQLPKLERDGIFMFQIVVSDREFADFVAAFAQVFEDGPAVWRENAQGQWKTLGGRLASLSEGSSGASLSDVFEAVWQRYTAEEFEALRKSHGIICGRAQRPAEVLRDAQVRHSQIVTEMVDPRFGAYAVARPPLRFGGEVDPGTGLGHAPLHGEHNADVRAELLGRYASAKALLGQS